MRSLVGVNAICVLVAAAVGVDAGGGVAAASPVEASRPCSVAHFFFGVPHHDDFEELSLTATDGHPGKITYQYGAKSKSLALEYLGPAQIKGKPGFDVRFPNKLVLHLARDGSYLRVTGGSRYDKSFVPGKVGDKSGCADELPQAEALQLVERTFSANGAASAPAAANEQPFSHGGAGIVFGTGGPVTIIVLSDGDDVCKTRRENFRRKGSSSLWFWMSSGDDHWAEEAGVYRVGGNKNSVTASLNKLDEHCSSHGVDAKSGKVTLTDVGDAASGVYEGSYDLLLEDGHHLKGSFRAPHCKAMDQSVTDIGNPKPDPTCR